jgi:TetR/AcrR family transcriptional repressor of bet genes
MARPSNTEQRRAQITQALMKVMARRGYDGASVAEIAGAARLTPGLLHYHFGSKQEILLAALADLVIHHDRALEARLAHADGDPIAEVEAFIDFHLRVGRDADPEALACWILLLGEALREPKVRVQMDKAIVGWVSRLRSVIQRGIDENVFAMKSSGAAAAASALVATIQGYFVMAAAARATIPKGSAAGATRSMAAGLLSPVRPFAPSEEPA